jgi:hypothetical protein
MARNMGYGSGDVTDVGLEALCLGGPSNGELTEEEEQAYLHSAAFQRASGTAQALRERHSDAAFFNMPRTTNWESSESEDSESEPESMPPHHSRR